MSKAIHYKIRDFHEIMPAVRLAKHAAQLTRFIIHVGDEGEDEFAHVESVRLSGGKNADGTDRSCYAIHEMTAGHEYMWHVVGGDAYTTYLTTVLNDLLSAFMMNQIGR